MYLGNKENRELPALTEG